MIKHPQVLFTQILLVLLFIQALPAEAQWIRKADALRRRSEVTSVAYNNKLYCFLGFNDADLNPESSCEVYDPATNKWTLLASIPAGKTI